jgi:maltose alpha-D-glucosyltransferase/alpha-amylase
MLNWTERMIRMRKEVPEIGWGSFSVLDCGDTGVLAMRYDWRNNAVVIIHNLHDKPVEITFDPGIGESGRVLIDIADGSNSRAAENNRHSMVLEPFGYRWYRAGGLDYLLKRSDI